MHAQRTSGHTNMEYLTEYVYGKTGKRKLFVKVAMPVGEGLVYLADCLYEGMSTLVWRIWSTEVAAHFPSFVDTRKFNQETAGWAIARYCPERVDKHFHFLHHSWAIARFCPEKLDKETFYWKDHSWAVAKYCSGKIDKELFNYATHSWAIAKYCPEYIDENFSWQDFTWAVAEYCPHLIDWDKVNRKQYVEWKKKQITKI